MKSLPTESTWRKLGWLTLLAFTIKGTITTALIVWGLLSVVN